MPTYFRVENYPSINIKESVSLAAAAAAGAVTITLEGIDNIAANDFLYIGRIGQEKVEKRKITSLAGAVATIPALTYDHGQYSPVLAVQGDKIQVYRAANVDGTPPADASFSTNGSAIDIDPDQVDTEYTDDTGSTSFWYKWRYYNSHTAAYVTDLSEVRAIRGAEYGNYTTVPEIRQEAGILNNPYISDAAVRAARAEAQSAINAALQGTYSVPISEPVPEVVRRATKLLAAGYLLRNEYGGGAVGTNANGQDKINEVFGTKDQPGLLTQITNGSLDLVTDDGTSLATREGVTGWPDSSTKDADVEDGGSKRFFRMGQIF